MVSSSWVERVSVNSCKQMGQKMSSVLSCDGGTGVVLVCEKKLSPHPYNDTKKQKVPKNFFTERTPKNVFELLLLISIKIFMTIARGENTFLAAVGVLYIVWYT